MSSSSKKRVFANNDTINFNDYLKRKTGNEIIKNIKSKPNYNTNINTFMNYEKFILLTKAYFNSFCKLKILFSISNHFFILSTNIVLSFILLFI